MLHIILVILKIAGILLAAILLLILAILLLLLFVPLRYEVSARYQKEDRWGKGRITWLFHLISLQAAYEFGKKPEISLKILGRTLFPKSSGKKPSKTAKRSSPEKEPTKTKSVRREKTTPRISEPAQENKGLPEKKKPEKKLQQTKLPEPSVMPETVPESATEKESLFQKIRNVFTEIPVKFRKMFEMLRQFRKAVRQMRQKLTDIQAKIQHYLDIWQAEETGSLRRDLWNYLCYILRHYRPGKIKGFLKYGFEDPAVTGQLTGILYILKPLAFANFELQPEFETSSLVIEGEVEMKGHIRLIHFVYVAIRLLLDKNLKYVIRRMKE